MSVYIDNFETIFGVKNNIQALRNKVLELAIQGKLVEQDPNDEPASELVKQIKAERERLVKEGKIKKQKALAPIEEDEIPFEVPDSWEWVRLESCSDMYTGNSIAKTVKLNKYTKIKDGYNYIATKDVGFDHVIDYSNGVKIPYDEKDFRYAEKDSTLLCIEGGSAGRKIGYLKEKVCFGNKLCSFHPISMNTLYLYYYLQSKFFIAIFKDNINGIIGGVSISKLKEVICPIPPLAEQHRIVQKVESLMSLIDQMENKLKVKTDLIEKMADV